MIIILFTEDPPSSLKDKDKKPTPFIKIDNQALVEKNGSNLSTISRTWGSKPISNILSASSNTCLLLLLSWESIIIILSILSFTSIISQKQVRNSSFITFIRNQMFSVSTTPLSGICYQPPQFITTSVHKGNVFPSFQKARTKNKYEFVSKITTYLVRLKKYQVTDESQADPISLAHIH